MILEVIGKSIVFVDCAISFGLGQANGILLAIGVIEPLFAVSNNDSKCKNCQSDANKIHNLIFAF